MEVSAGAEVRIHDPWVDPSMAPVVPKRCEITGDLQVVPGSTDATVIFASQKYWILIPAEVKALCGCSHPVFVDGGNVAEPDVWIGKGFVYRVIGREDKNGHLIIE